MDKKFTPKQARFIEEYMIDLNATKAAIRAGYSEKTAMEQGYQLLHKTSIKEEIERLKKETSKELKITKESIIKDLLHIKNMCINDPKYISNSTKAIEVINKMLGYNEPEKTDITTNGGSISDIKINIIKPKDGD